MAYPRFFLFSSFSSCPFHLSSVEDLARRGSVRVARFGRWHGLFIRSRVDAMLLEDALVPRAWLVYDDRRPPTSSPTTAERFDPSPPCAGVDGPGEGMQGPCARHPFSALNLTGSSSRCADVALWDRLPPYGPILSTRSSKSEWSATVGGSWVRALARARPRCAKRASLPGEG